jgi:hypothetical protein
MYLLLISEYDMKNSLHAVAPTNKLDVATANTFATASVSEYELVQVLATNFILHKVSNCVNVIQIKPTPAVRGLEILDVRASE